MTHRRGFLGMLAGLFALPQAKDGAEKCPLGHRIEAIEQAKEALRLTEKEK